MTVSPESATVSIAAAADLVFTVSAATGATLTTLRNASSAVNSSNYTFENGRLTIKAAYLAGLTAGDKVFTLVMSDGTTAAVNVTVTA